MNNVDFDLEKLTKRVYGSEIPENVKISCLGLKESLRAGLSERDLLVLIGILSCGQIKDDKGLKVANNIIDGFDCFEKHFTTITLDKRDFVGLTKSIYGSSSKENRECLFRHISRLNTDVSFRSSCSDGGFITHKIPLLIFGKTITDMETGDILIAEFVLSPILFAGLTNYYACVNIRTLCTISKLKGGNNALLVIFHILSNWPRISQERKKGAYTMEVKFEDVFPKGSTTYYYKQIESAANLADEIKDVVGASKVEVIRKTGKKDTPTGLKVTFERKVNSKLNVK